MLISTCEVGTLLWGYLHCIDENTWGWEKLMYLDHIGIKWSLDAHPCPPKLAVPLNTSYFVSHHIVSVAFRKWHDAPELSVRDTDG